MLWRLEQSGLALPLDLRATAYPVKARDVREPGRREKQENEKQFAALLLSFWREQASAIRHRLQAQLQAKASRADEIFDAAFWEEQESILPRLTDLLASFAANGIDIFAAQVAVGLDYDLVNARAADWARDYAFDLVRDINDTTREMLRTQVATFVETPGYTLRDIMTALPFDEERAARVAVTEITRAYASANQLAGEELVRQFPDLRVVKIWNTNRDERVCPICEPLDGRRMELDAPFDSDIAQPPAHVNCRCWMATTTETNA